MPMTFWGLGIGAWMRASPRGTVSSPGSGLPPYSMNSIMSSWASGLISSPSNDPTRVSPPSTEYVTSFKRSPVPRGRNDTHLSSKVRPSALLWLQAFYLPAVAGPPVDESIVQPALAPLPELDDLGLDPVAAPEGRTWDLTPFVPGFELPYPFLQNASVLDGPALF